MKNKITATVLLMAMLLTVGCGSTDDVTAESSSNEASSVTESNEEKLTIPDYGIDLEDNDFNILYFDAITACGWSSDIPYDVDAEDTNGDILNDAVYDRNRRIEDMYNLNITVQMESWEVYSVLERSVMANEGAYDAAFVKQQGFQSPAANGYLAELDDLFDFSKPWWDEKSFEGFGVCGKTYAITGDITFMDKLCDIVIFFNKSMADEYKLGDIYQMVIDKKWTFSEMLKMCEMVSADLNENGSADTADRFGFAGQNDASYELFHSSGERFCTLDENGIPYMSNTTERAIDIMTNIYTFMNDKSNFFNRSTANISVADAIEMFKANRVLS